MIENRIKVLLKNLNVSYLEISKKLNISRTDVKILQKTEINPHYIFTRNIPVAFPEVNCEWLLLLRNGEMFKN